MKDIGYVLKRLTDMNYGALFEKLNSLRKKTGRSKAFLLWDMLNCAVKYGAGYMDYDLFEMYDLTPAQRDTYITRGRNNALIKKYNDLSYAHYFDNKAEFYTRFADFIRKSRFGKPNTIFAQSAQRHRRGNSRCAATDYRHVIHLIHSP